MSEKDEIAARIQGNLDRLSNILKEEIDTRKEDIKGKGKN